MTNVSGPPPVGTPPRTFGSFQAPVIRELLGPPPSNISQTDLPFRPADWVEDIEGADYLYRALARLLWERGSTPEAARSIRRDLQAGKLPAVALLPDGRLHPLEPTRFRGEHSRWLWFTGRADVMVTTGPRIGRFDAEVYLTQGDDVEAPPMSEHMNSARQETPDELSPRERPTVHKLILGMAARGYGYRPPQPGQRTKVVPDIVGDLDRLGLTLSDETVRKWLSDAYEALGRPDLD